MATKKQKPPTSTAEDKLAGWLTSLWQRWFGPSKAAVFFIDMIDLLNERIALLAKSLEETQKDLRYLRHDFDQHKTQERTSGQEARDELLDASSDFSAYKRAIADDCKQFNQRIADIEAEIKHRDYSRLDLRLEALEKHVHGNYNDIPLANGSAISTANMNNPNRVKSSHWGMLVDMPDIIDEDEVDRGGVVNHSASQYKAFCGKTKGDVHGSDSNEVTNQYTEAAGRLYPG